MKKILISFSLIIMLSLLMSCKKDNSLSNSVFEKLLGTWNWVESSDGLGGVTFTPAIAGYTLMIEFYKDRIYKSYENGIQQEKYRFTLTNEYSNNYSDSIYLLNFNSSDFFSHNQQCSGETIRFGGQDTLIIYEEHYYYKRFSIYTRKK